jgi:hypothetical protein
MTNAWISPWLAALLAMPLLAAPVHAQTAGDGRITGIVRDPSGAVVPGATVVARNERTNEERDTTSSSQGRYLITGLRPSVYHVEAKLTGFQPVQFKTVTLQAGEELTIDAVLRVAGQSEDVTVIGEERVVDSSSARMGANVNEREVHYLPINGRQLSQLYLQAPGALNSGTGTFSDIRFSGRAVEQNVIRYDGGLLPSDTPQEKSSKDNWQPRASFAWALLEALLGATLEFEARPAPDTETVARERSKTA